MLLRRFEYLPAFLIFGFNLGIFDLLFKIFLEIPFPLFLSLVPPERREVGMGTASGEGVLSGSFGCRWAFKDGGIKIPCGVEVDGAGGFLRLLRLEEVECDFELEEVG